MKIRNGFVSNSSSSSFIIIGDTISNVLIDRVKKDIFNNIVFIDGKGTTQFGWDNVKYTSFWDRLNFATVQIMSLYWNKPEKEYKTSDKYIMLEDVLKSNLGIKEIRNKLSLEYDCRKSEYYAYIDHQSCSTEGANMEIFENKDVLTRFLFSIDSYIQGGNDNG